MGLIFNKTISLSDVSEIIKYNNGFCELIAIQDIPAGTHLINSLDSRETRFKRHLGTYMNDDDFIYPINLTENAIVKTISMYEKVNNNNCYQYDNNYFITTRNIKRGEALTKRYGLTRWFVWLCTDIMGDNPFVLRNRDKSNLYCGKYFLPNYNLNGIEKEKAIKLLIKIAAEFKYTLKFIPKK